MRKNLFWVFMHTLLIVVVVIQLLTGFRIATVHRPSVMLWSAFLPQGQLHSLHLGLGAGLLTLFVVYCCYRIYEHCTVQVEYQKKLSSLYHWLVTQLGLLCLISLLLTGGLLYFGVFASEQMLDFHFFAALGLLLYIPLHAGIYFVQYGVKLLLVTFSPSQHNRKTGVKLIVASLSVGAVILFSFANNTPHTLNVYPVDISRYIKIDGLANESTWDNIEPHVVHTYGGANFNNGVTNVEIKALQNGVDAFFHIRWDDPTFSINHLPLRKTESGWQVQENGYYRFDEQSHYEDKFAVIVSENCELAAAGTAHLGPNPLADKPKNWHGKGYHYSAEPGKKMVDLWQWKAVRTNNMVLMDDNYITTPEPVRAGSRRYTAGYQKDAKLSGSYVMNWHWYSPKGIVPKRIPQNIDAKEVVEAELATGKLFPVLAWDDTQPYQEQLDAMPIGASLPAVLYRSNRFEGDRADIRAYATWKEGKWSLELARKLETGSEYDVALKAGVCLWFAAFDHSQIAHTRHSRPVQLVFN